MTTSHEVIKPPKPEPRLCAGNCGVMVNPIFIEPVIMFTKPMYGTNIWDRPKLCEDCQKKEEDEKQKRRLLEIEEQNRRAEEDAKKKAKEKLIKALGQKGFDEFYFDRFQCDLSTNDAFKTCQNFNYESQNLYLWGPAGTGKSHLAGAIFRRYQGGIFIKHAKLNRIFQGLKNDEYEKLLEEFTHCPVLIIDDLGTAKQTEYADQVLYEIIDDRQMAYKNGLVVTSNLSLKDLADRLGDDRLTSRIAGLCKTVKIESMDRRLKKS